MAVGHGSCVSPVSYLIVHEGDGSVLAEFERVQDAVRAMAAARVARLEPLRLIVFEDSGGAVARTESWISVRTLGNPSKASRPRSGRPARRRSPRRGSA